MGPPPTPGGNGSGAVGKSTMPSCRGGNHEPSNQIVAESGAVDHLDEKVVGDCVKRLRDVCRYGFGSAIGLTLVKARDHPIRDGELGQGSGVPRFKAELGQASVQHLHDLREYKPL